MNLRLPDKEDGRWPSFVWPGGYAIAYIADDGEYLCADCVNDPGNPVHTDVPPDGWQLVGYTTADWHDVGEGDWTCAHCGRVIDPDPGE